MNKREYCESRPSVAYYSGFHGLEIKGIEYGPDEYVYCVSGAWGPKSKHRYHKVKIQCTRYGQHYFVIRGWRVPLADCIRMESPC